MPLLAFEAFDAAEFVQISRHHGPSVGAGDVGDEVINRADRGTSLFKFGTKYTVAVYFGESQARPRLRRSHHSAHTGCGDECGDRQTIQHLL